MPTFEIICLANSFKHGGRCIAGFKTDGSGWIRPVSKKIDGTLYEEHYQLSDGGVPVLFSILRIECYKPNPQCHQPENWVVSEGTWEQVGMAKIEQLNQLLAYEIHQASKGSALLGNCSDRWEWNGLQENPIAHSLCLIKPQNLMWKILTSRYSDKRKVRAIFNLQDIQYDLGITDPEWIELINPLPDGEYDSEDLINELELEDFDPDKFLLTISLGEPFQPPLEESDYCFKLVAAVINTQKVRALLS